MSQELPFKNIVHYTKILSDVEVGYSCTVIPTDHTSYRVRNGYPCYTSCVVAYDKETGRIETLNSIFIPEVTE